LVDDGRVGGVFTDTTEKEKSVAYVMVSRKLGLVLVVEKHIYKESWEFTAYGSCYSRLVGPLPWNLSMAKCSQLVCMLSGVLL